MKNKILFFKEFLINPKAVGSLIPSSQYLAKSITVDISKKDNIIVEFGPGNGVFTKEILKKMSLNSKLILFETNKVFANKLKEIYKKDSRVIILNDSATEINKTLKVLKIKKVDFIISGLPFLSIEDSIRESILKESEKSLSENGQFLLFQYSNFYKNLFTKYFKLADRKRVIRNFPPAIIYKLSKF